MDNNPDKILRSESGRPYAPTSYDKFREQWLSMDGDKKLQRIKYDSQYRTSYKTAIAMRKKAQEYDPNLKLSLDEVKKMNTYDFRKSFLDNAIDDYRKRTIKQYVQDYRSAHNISDDISNSDIWNKFISGNEKRDLNRLIGKSVTFDFFGGS